MISQSQLDLFARRDRSAEPEHVVRLEAMLAEFGRWLTAEELSQLAPDWTDRKVRALASASDCIVSWPGSPGYKHLRHCTVEEFARFEQATQSQIARMDERLRRARRAYHARNFQPTAA